MTKIEDYIKTLEKLKDDGWVYMYPDFFGLNSIRVSRNENKLKRFFYIDIELYPEESNELYPEPIHSNRVKVEVVSYEFEDYRERNEINVKLNLKPLEDLPNWYKESKHFNDNYCDDFMDVGLCNLKWSWK